MRWGVWYIQNNEILIMVEGVPLGGRPPPIHPSNGVGLHNKPHKAQQGGSGGVGGGGTPTRCLAGIKGLPVLDVRAPRETPHRLGNRLHSPWPHLHLGAFLASQGSPHTTLESLQAPARIVLESPL